MYVLKKCNKAVITIEGCVYMPTTEIFVYMYLEFSVFFSLFHYFSLWFCKKMSK